MATPNEDLIDFDGDTSDIFDDVVTITSNDLDGIFIHGSSNQSSFSEIPSCDGSPVNRIGEPSESDDSVFVDSDNEAFQTAKDVMEQIDKMSPMLSPDMLSDKRVKRKSTSSFTEAARLSTQYFDMSKNLSDGDHREIETEEVEKLMESLGCSFDEARLSLVKRQMRDAGIDPDTGLPMQEPSSSSSLSSSSRTPNSVTRLRQSWNNLLTATRPPTTSHVTDGWNQLELTMTVKGMDTSDLCQAMEAEKVKEQANKARLRYAFAKLSSKLSSSSDTPNFETARAWIEVHQARHIRVIAIGDGEALEDPNDNDFELVLTTEPQPLGGNIAFVVTAMLTLPPTPAYVDILFQCVIGYGTTNKVIGKAMCKSSELFSMKTHALMLESTVANAVDSILCIESEASHRRYKPNILPTARWLSQAYRLESQLEVPSMVYEELCETDLAYEVPAKFLKLRADELLDEHARLEGKVGEVEIIMTDFAGYYSQANQNVQQHTSMEGDLVVVDIAHEQDRVRRQQGVALAALQDLVQRAGTQVRNYRTLCKYYRDCLEAGNHTKYSSHKTEGALRAVPTNLHLHSVTAIPLSTSTNGDYVDSTIDINDSNNNTTTTINTDSIDNSDHNTSTNNATENSTTNDDDDNNNNDDTDTTPTNNNNNNNDSNNIINTNSATENSTTNDNTHTNNDTNDDNGDSNITDPADTNTDVNNNNNVNSKDNNKDTNTTKSPPKFHTHCTVTAGAPAATALGFSCGGLQSILDNINQTGLRLGCEHLVTTPCIHWSAAYAIRTIHGENFSEAEPWSTVQSEAALARLLFEFRIRIDTVLGQALTLITTSFMVRLQEAYNQNTPEMIERYVSTGFLCSFESLLSTMGSEQKMLRDVRTAVTVMKQAFEFRIHRRQPSQENDHVVVVKNKSLTGYYIDVLVDDVVYAWMPQTCKGADVTICMLPVLFTQGVNEWQKLSNLVGTNSLQATINNASLQLLQHYSGKCTADERKSGTVSRATRLASQHIMDLTNPSKEKKKDHEMLWMAADSCRMLGGGRVTFCKSGKDRTAQAVTLESTRLLCRHDGLKSSWELWLANLMRVNGVRRSNVYYNTGQFSYAFNSLQVRTLPPPYRPPPSTHK